ncbi:MAG: zinc D-Ala-D-Ala dipeptidase [Thermoleophilaceae bacterium]|nr:zinc D-Ala-D-Ala dipeptidase [Thermoleophilaceae bacterium]
MWVELALRAGDARAELRNVRHLPAITLIALLALTGTAEAGFRAQLGRAGLEDVRDRAAGIGVDLRYATAGNFTGKRLPGYCTAEPFLRARAASALGRAQEKLAAGGLGLRVFDAYRPSRASRAMVRWAKRTGREYLLHGLIAARSNHNRGAAVDLTLVRLEGGRALSMGTPFDSFSKKAATGAVTGKPLRNRLRLRRALEAEGFRNYAREWWHYDFPSELGAPRLDIALGC